MQTQTRAQAAEAVTSTSNAPLFQQLWARDQWPGLPPYRSILSPLLLLERTLHVCPEQLGVVDGDRRLTYADFGRRVYRLASALRQRGIAQHDRVAVLCRNSSEVLEAHFAVPQLGAALVPINVRLSAEEIGYILGHSGAKALILDHDLAPAVASVRADLPELELIVGVDLAARHGGQPPELPAEELIAFARERLAHFKCPRAVEFGPLPKTSTGKIQKFVLRDREWAGYEKRIH